MTLEQRIRSAEAELFAGVGAEPEASFHELAATGLRVRVLSHGRGAPVVLLHGVSLGAAAWAPLFNALSGCQLLAVDLPGHGLSDPVGYRRGHVRQHARALIDDLFEALGLDEAPVVGHSLGGMLALWHAAAGVESTYYAYPPAGPRTREPLPRSCTRSTTSAARGPRAS